MKSKKGFPHKMTKNEVNAYNRIQKAETKRAGLNFTAGNELGLKSTKGADKTNTFGSRLMGKNGYQS